MDENTRNREANLRAMQRLLDYAIIESRVAGLPEVGKLLAVALEMVGKSLSPDARPTVPVRTGPLGLGKIRLVACRDTHYKKGNEKI